MNDKLIQFVTDIANFPEENDILQSHIDHCQLLYLKTLASHVLRARELLKLVENEQ